MFRNVNMTFLERKKEMYARIRIKMYLRTPVYHILDNALDGCACMYCISIVR